MQTELIIIIGLAMGYGYLNGLHGSANIVATIISARALSPRAALILATIGISLGPFLLGMAVARTIGTQLMHPASTTPAVIVAALSGAILWSSFTLWLKIPSSISQALIGGILGAVWLDYGFSGGQIAGLNKTLAALFLSPLLGLIVGFVAVRVVYRLSVMATPRINRSFNRAQILVALLMAIAFGANDGQKIIAMMALGLMATGQTQTFMIPDWIITLSAAMIGIGSLVGGWRLIHTLGGKFYKIRPIHGFGAQFSSALIIFGVGMLGGPLSGSQVVTSSILGAGSADGIQRVRWGVGQQILMGWLLTMPISALISALIYQIIMRVKVF